MSEICANQAIMKDFRREKELLQWIRYGGWDTGNPHMEKRVQQLLEEGIDINFIEGVTDQEDDDLPLYMRCYDGGESKQTLLMHAIENSSFWIATLLIENGANLELTNQKGQTPLLLASNLGYKHFVTMLLDNGAYVDAIDHEGNTPLLVAVNRGHLEISSLLLAIGSNANTINKRGHSALLDACINQYPAMVTLLLDFDAEINQTIGRALYTPLMIACKYHAYDIIQCLLDRGADIHRTNLNAQSAFQILTTNSERGTAIRRPRNREKPEGDINFAKILSIFATKGNICVDE